MGKGLGGPRSAWEAGTETPGRLSWGSSCPVWYLAGEGGGQGSDSPPVQQGQRPSQVQEALPRWSQRGGLGVGTGER